MAKTIVANVDYNFNAAGQEVSFGAPYTGLELQNILLITNVTTNEIIYQFNKAGYGGSLAGLVLTLDFNTSGMNNTDDLQIIVDAPFITTGGSAGTEYTEGDVDATITGQAVLMEGAGDTLVPLQGTAADGVLVNLGANNDVTVSGSVAVTDGGGSLTVDGTVAATQSGAWNINNVTGAVSLPTGAATEAKQDTIIGHVDGIETVLGTIDADTGAIAASTATIAGAVSGTEMQVDVVSMPTVTVQATDLDVRDLAFATDKVDASGSSVSISALPNEGQQLMAGSISVAVASDQTAIPVTVQEPLSIDDNGGSITVDATSLPLPTGAATSANQATIIGHVDGIEGLLGTIDADTSALAGTVVGTELQVDVVTMPTVTVQATDLDVRDLAFATDKVDASGSSVSISALPNEGQQSMANSISVAVASDQSALPVTDGGGSLTVDGTVAATQSGTWATRTQDGAGAAVTSHVAGASTGLDVSIIDGAGNQVTNFGSGTQYTEGDTDATITGTAMLWEDAGDTLAPVSSASPLPVNIVAGAASGTEYTEGDTDASISGTAIMWEDTADTLRPVSAANPLPVDVVTPTVAWGVTEAITTTAYALGSAAYNAVSSLADDYILSNIQFNFSTTQARDITITDADGTIIYETLGDTSLSLVLQDIDMSFDGGNNFTIDVTQTAGACAMDVTANVRQGVTALIGNADVDLHDGFGNAISSHVAGGSRGVDVSIIDGSGNQITNFGGGIQYTEGDTDASIVGTVTLMEAAGDTVVPLQGTVADGLLVNLGTNNDVTVSNTVSVSDGGGSLTIDAASLPLPTGAASEATLATVETNTDFGAVVGGGTETGALRVTIANNSTGVVSVDDNGGSLTVDGAVAATQSGSWDINNITGTVSLPTGAATSAFQSSMLLSLQDLGGTVATDNGAKPVDMLLVGGSDGTNARSISTNTSGHVNIADGGNSLTVDGTVAATQSGAWSTTATGNVAHDGADSGNPVKIGARAVAHGTNPTAVAAGDRTDVYANRHGIPFSIGGHPNVITRTAYIADASGAQTDASIVGTINAGTKVVVTSVAVTVDSAVTATGGVAVKLGFGAASIPADSATGANGILLDHKGIAAGSGIVLGSGAGILGIGADGEELRLTCEDPVGGGLSVTISYYTIES